MRRYHHRFLGKSTTKAIADRHRVGFSLGWLIEGDTSGCFAGTPCKTAAPGSREGSAVAVAIDVASQYLGLGYWNDRK